MDTSPRTEKNQKEREMCIIGERWLGKRFVHEKKNSPSSVLWRRACVRSTWSRTVRSLLRVRSRVADLRG